MDLVIPVINLETQLINKGRAVTPCFERLIINVSYSLMNNLKPQESHLK